MNIIWIILGASYLLSLFVQKMQRSTVPKNIQ